MQPTTRSADPALSTPEDRRRVILEAERVLKAARELLNQLDQQLPGPAPEHPWARLSELQLMP